MDTVDFGDLEFICVVLKFQHKNIYVATVYIPPGSPSTTYESLASSIDKLTDVMLPSDDLLLLGDFNIPSVEWECSCDNDYLLPVLSSAPRHISSFLDCLMSSGLLQSCSVKNGSNRSLDLVFTTDHYGTVVKRCPVPWIPESSHHPTLHVVFCYEPSSTSPPHFHETCFNFKKADFSNLNSYLLNCDWRNVLRERDIDKAVQLLYDTLSDCFAHCVPISKARNLQSCQPWLNNSLKHLKNLKNKAWKRFCSSGSDTDYSVYSDLHNQFISNSEIAYLDYVRKIKDSLRSEPKQFWKFVNSKRRVDGYPAALCLADVESCDPLTTANLFADFFGTAFSKSDCDINLSNFINLTKFPPTSLETKDLLLDEETILRRISDISESYWCGPDGIPSVVLKRCGLSLVSVLCHLFNLSLHCGVFPTLWKQSIIIPLHKKGNKDDISNYRPIANLSCIPKLFEALVCDVLCFHCKPFLESFQHGFSKGKSTTTNLMEFSHFCISAIEAGKQVDCVYTDFSKAFDKINHRILTHKLTCLGFPPPLFIKWLGSYLSGRTQQVLFRGALSTDINNTSGVPQGSHLGPLLFIIYINDAGSFLANSKILCYADDAKLFRVTSDHNDCSLLNSDLASFYNWCSINHLPLNVSKCTTVSFSRKRCPLHFDYTLNGNSLTRVDRVKDLGVIFNSRFTFEDHIDSIVGKANAILGFVKRWTREFADPYVAKSLYCALVRPILEYASPVWAPFYAVHINRIEAVQRRFLRFALHGLPWNDPVFLPPYSERLNLISLDTLVARRNYSRIIVAFDILQGVINSPELLSALSISVPARSLRSHDFFHIPYHRMNYGLHEPIASMSRLFNSSYAECIDFNLSRIHVKGQLS